MTGRGEMGCGRGKRDGWIKAVAGVGLIFFNQGVGLYTPENLRGLIG